MTRPDEVFAALRAENAALRAENETLRAAAQEFRRLAEERDKLLSATRNRIAELEGLLRSQRDKARPHHLSGVKSGAFRRGEASDLDFARRRARLAWGDACPPWISALAAECDRTSQAAAARALGVSAATVNLALGKRYIGRLDRLQESVEALGWHG